MKGNDYIHPWTCLKVHKGNVQCYHIFAMDKATADAMVRNCGKDTEHVNVLTDEQAKKLYKQLHAVYGRK